MLGLTTGQGNLSTLYGKELAENLKKPSGSRGSKVMMWITGIITLATILVVTWLLLNVITDIRKEEDIKNVKLQREIKYRGIGLLEV